MDRTETTRSRSGVGERLREARQSQNLSLARVAEKAGISAATLSRIETNKQSVDIDLFLSLARILKVAATMILGGDGSVEHDPFSARVSKLSSHQRTRMWRDLAAARRTDRSGAQRAALSLTQQMEELAAQVDFLREEIESVLSRVRRRK